MKKKKIRISIDIPEEQILKETKEERKKRISSRPLSTKVVPDRKNRYNRQKYKKGGSEDE